MKKRTTTGDSKKRAARRLKRRAIKRSPPRSIQVRVTYVGHSAPFDLMLFQAAGDVVGGRNRISGSTKTKRSPLRYSDVSGFGLQVRDHSWLFEGKDWGKACDLAELFTKIPGLRGVELVIDALMVEESKQQQPMRTLPRRKKGTWSSTSTRKRRRKP